MEAIEELWNFLRGQFPIDKLPLGVSIVCFLIGFAVSLGYVASLLPEEGLKDAKAVGATTGFCLLFYIMFSFLNISAASLFENEWIFYLLALLEVLCIVAMFFFMYYIVMIKPSKDAAAWIDGQDLEEGEAVKAKVSSRTSVSQLVRADIFISFAVFAFFTILAKIIVFLIG